MTTETSSLSGASSWTTRRSGPAAGRTTVLGRVFGPVLLGTTGLLVAGEHAYRHQELASAAWFVGRLLGLRTMLLAGPSAPVLYAGTDAGLHRGIALTAGCSSALLMAPFALLTGLLLLFSTRRPVRLLLAFAVAAALLVATNLGRITLIVAMQHHLGEEGFGWAHVLFGSVLMMAAALAAFLLYLRIVARGTAPDGKEPEQ
ncbi:archaeosortase/exosortase family protein [Kitasatospora sp. NPDC057692]|uniref:archaeosortase/exosortase family protein n=1 Tax=Kitasatospora sp. NPDC057692 TaxID=3346215 RepID=UPI0036B09029